MLLQLHPRRSRLPRLLAGVALAALALASAQPGTGATACENPSHHAHAGAAPGAADVAGDPAADGGHGVRAANHHGGISMSDTSATVAASTEAGADDCGHCPPDDCVSDPGCDATVYFAVAPRMGTTSWTASSDAGWHLASASGQIPYQPRRPPRAGI